MGLLKPGYWHDKYYPKSFWNEDYWQAFAAEITSTLIINGYWNEKFWPKRYWDENYWLQYGGAIAASLVKNGWWNRLYWPRSMWAQDWWLEWGGATEEGGRTPRGGYIEDDPLNVQEYGRRPYVGGSGGGGTGYYEQMKRTPDKAVFNELLKRQSEFKKPYLEDDYQEMEYWYPYPPFDFNFGWPSFNWDDDGNIVNEGWVDVHTDDYPCPTYLIGQGIIHECDREYSYRIPPSSSRGFSNVKLIGPSKDDCELIRYNRTTAYIKCNADSTGSRFPKIIICYDLEGVPKTRTDCTCTFEVINSCSLCNCLSTPAQSFVDAGTSDTIAPGGIAALTIIDGCPPYTYSTSSNGYTITNLVTNDTINSVSCVPAGVCGVDFDPVLTVQVTDSCGSSVTKDIRNTAGQWGAANDGVCLLSGDADNCSLGGAPYYCEKTEGKYYQYQEITTTGGGACVMCCVPVNKPPACGVNTWCDKFYTLSVGSDQCIMDSSIDVCSDSHCNTCWYNFNIYYKEWTC